jgi:hypothetical protein
LNSVANFCQSGIIFIGYLVSSELDGLVILCNEGDEYGKYVLIADRHEGYHNVIQPPDDYGDP